MLWIIWLFDRHAPTVARREGSLTQGRRLLSSQELFDYVILLGGLAIIQAAAMFTAFYLGKRNGREAAELKQCPGRQRSPHRETGRRFASKPRLQRTDDQPDT